MLSFQRSGGMWTKKNYMKLIEEEEEAGFFFWGVGEAILILLIRKCGVCLDFDSNQLGMEVPVEFFFS